MHPNANKKYQGIDYLRLTAGDHKPYEAWSDALSSEFVAEDNAGRKPHYRWILSYYGRVGEHCFVGKGEQGSMVQVSGRLADVMFSEVSKAGGRCSRIDCQVTATAIPNQDEHLKSAYEEAKGREKGRGKPAQIELRDTAEGAKMLTIGSRQSQVYARVYDKHRESKDNHYAGMLRWELECKEETARDLHHWFMDDINRQYTVESIVGDWFTKRGITLFWDELEMTELPKDVKRTRTDDTRLAWITNQVRPTIKELLIRGKEMELAKAMSDDNASIEAVKELAKALKDMFVSTGEWPF
jgi:hypothetical protein